MKITSTTAPMRRRAGLLVVVAVALALTGCSVGSGDSGGSGAGSSPSAGDNTDPNHTGSTWADIKKRGIINIAVGLTTPPFGLTDKNGKPSGFDVDVANQLADYLGVKANIFEVSADGRIPALQSGKADLVSFTLTVTPERQQQIDFSDGVIHAYQGVAVKKSSGITSNKQIADKTIAVQKGALGATVAAAAYPNATLQQYDSEVNTILAARQGQADAVVDGIAQLTYNIKDDSSMKLLPGLVAGDSVQSYALGIQKGDDSLTKKVNAFLKQFHAKGEGTKLYKKWFGAEPPADLFKGFEN